MKPNCRVVVFGAGASKGARLAPCPPLGNNLHNYVARYLEKKFTELRKWDSYDFTTDLTPPIFPFIQHDEPRVDDAFIEHHDVYDDFLVKNFATNKERSNASFITLNYDCLLERAICRTFFNGPQDGESRCLCKHVDYKLDFPSQGCMEIEVLKPHGSINWTGNLEGSENEGGTIPITVSLERDGRPTYTQVDIVSSPVGRDPDELIIAHYATGKAPQANPEQLFTIQKVAKSRVRDASRVEIIGLHLPEDFI